MANCKSQFQRVRIRAIVLCESKISQNFKVVNFLMLKLKGGCLNLCWACLDQDTQSRHRQQVCPDCQEIFTEIETYNFVLMWLRSRMLISTLEKGLSRQSRKSRHLKMLVWSRSLNQDWEISILPWHHLPVLKVSTKIYQFVEVSDGEVPQKVYKMSIHLDKYWKVSIDPENIDSPDWKVSTLKNQKERSRPRRKSRHRKKS